MNRIDIPRIGQEVTLAADIPAAMQQAGIPYVPVSCINWPESYPYKPEMTFAAAHTGDALLLHYRVEEQSVRAVARRDHEHIWEDSCAEFFCMPADDGLYYNVECNCTGKLLLAVGKGRNDREPAPADVMQTIDRYASLGSAPFDTREGLTRWELALRLPLQAFFRHKLCTLDGLRAKGNVYKCGDLLPVQHFVSLYPIRTNSPDFHRSEFFGQMVFE